MSSYNHENNFVTFGIGLVVVAVMGMFIGTTTLLDVGAAVFAAYVVLRLVNIMSYAANNRRH